MSKPATEPQKDVDAFLNGLPDWTSETRSIEQKKPPEIVLLPDPKGNKVPNKVTMSQNSTNDCAFHEIPVPVVAKDDIWPGVLLSGNSIRSGAPAPVPVRGRPPITVSIDVHIANPTRTVEDPNSATVAKAVGDLIREADSRIGSDKLDLIPAQVECKCSEAYSLEQSLIHVGISASCAGDFASLSGAFDYSKNQEHRSVIGLMIQKLFTVSISDDLFDQPSEFSDPRRR